VGGVRAVGGHGWPPSSAHGWLERARTPPTRSGVCDTAGASKMNPPRLGLAAYARITANYWAFTITDGAIRMLVVLFFPPAGLQRAGDRLLFLFYEFFGVVTNLTGGWLAARLGVNTTLVSGTLLQIGALLMLTVPEAWLSVAYVMFAQALSGIAKDLNKMSAKSGVKLVAGDVQGRLFRWVAWLTGSKNALKGLGFFIGAALLYSVGFQAALVLLAGMLALSHDPGRAGVAARSGGWAASRSSPRCSPTAPRSTSCRPRASSCSGRGMSGSWSRYRCSCPQALDWNHMQVGAFLALWIIGYGIVQAAVPSLIARKGLGAPDRSDREGLGAGADADSRRHRNRPGDRARSGVRAHRRAGRVRGGLRDQLRGPLLPDPGLRRVRPGRDEGRLLLYGERGRALVGTVLSGWIFMTHGLIGCLIASSVFVFAAWMLSSLLPRGPAPGPGVVRS
jgi:hypothetical protein